MDDEKEKLVDDIRRDIHRSYGVRFTYLAAATMIAIGWVLYLVKVIFNVDLLGFMHSTDPGDHHPPDPSTAYLIAAILVTLIAVPWSIKKAGKTRHLSANGLRTQGKIVSMALLGKNGMKPSTIVYTVDGKEYRIRKDLYAKLHAEGDTVDILYDPKNPGSCDVM